MKKNLFYLMMLLFSTTSLLATTSTATCADPTGFNIIRTSPTTAEFSVASNDSSLKYDLYVDLKGNAAPSASSNPKSHFANLSMPYSNSNLIASNEYSVWIRQNCSTTKSNWVGPIDILEYTEPVASCDNPTGFDVVRTSDTTAVISVDNPNDIYDVFISVDGSPGANPNSGPTPGPNDNVTGFPQTRTGLNANSVYDVWIRKECNGDNSDWVGPVHVPIYQAPAPTCDNPTGFDVVRTSHTTAVISVDNPNDIYDVFISVDGSPGANPNSGPTPGPNDNVTGFPQTRTGLNANSVYDVWIRKVCNGDNSDWVGPVHVPLFVDPNVCAIPNPTINRTSPTDIEISTDVAVYDMLLNTQPSKPGVAPHNPQSQFTNLSGTLTRNNLNPGMTYYVWFRQKCSTTDISDWSQMYTISPVAQQALKLYPNPAVAQVRIEGTDAVSVQVIGMSGKVEMSTKVVNNQINLDGLAPGQYIIQATDAQGNVTTSKLMKK